MIRKIKLATFETSFVFEIDTELFPVEDAKLVNEFFIDNETRMDKFDNDVHVAALSLYASILFQILVEHQPSIKNFAYYFNRENWEGFVLMYESDNKKTHHGIKLIDYDYSFDIPEAEDFEIEQVN